jgi:hypothetical protein
MLGDFSGVGGYQISVAMIVILLDAALGTGAKVLVSRYPVNTTFAFGAAPTSEASACFAAVIAAAKCEPRVASPAWDLNRPARAFEASRNKSSIFSALGRRRF